MIKIFSLSFSGVSSTLQDEGVSVGTSDFFSIIDLKLDSSVEENSVCFSETDFMLVSLS